MDAFFVVVAKYFFVLPVVILGAYFFMHSWGEQKRMALFAIPAGILTFALGRLAGLIYFDPRPFVVEHFTPLVAHAADNGFPSDHTLLVAALAMVGTYWNARLGITLWILAVLVAVSRVYVGVHHPIDVAASIIIALVAVFVWDRLLRYWQGKAPLSIQHVDKK